MAGKLQEEQIAATLNRLGLKTGTSQTWSENRVYSATPLPSTINCQRMIRRLIKLKKIPASQVVTCAPRQIPAEALESEEVRRAVRNIKAQVRVPQTQDSGQQSSMFPMV